MSIKSRAPIFPNAAEKWFDAGPRLIDLWSAISGGGQAHFQAPAEETAETPAGGTIAGPIGETPLSITLTAGGLSYTQNFDTLAQSGTASASTLPADWFFSESGTAANTTYSAGTGSVATGDTYSFGVAGTNAITDRALGQLRSGSVTSILGASFTNSTGSTISQLDISYVGEQWRVGGPHATIGDKMDFQISFDATSLTTGTWVDVNALDFASLITGSAATLDGNAAANHTSLSAIISSLAIASGATFWIRWVDVDATGSDDGLAIDDFSLTAHLAGPSPGAFSVADVTQNEGGSGTSTFTFTVTRANGSAGAVTVDYAVAGSGAHPADAADFSGGVLPSVGTVSFADGETSRTFTIDVQGDHLIESDETFAVTLSNPTGGATIGTGTATGTITNDDFPGAFSLAGDQSASEAGVGLTFTVNRAGGSAGAATISYAVTASGAHPVDAADFGGLLPTGTVDFADGETSKTITITPTNDSDFESDETFTLTLSSPTAGTIGTATAIGTVTNDDPPPPVGVFSLAGDASALEGAGTISFTVNRTGGSTGAADVDYVVTGSGVHPADGTDFSGSLPSGTVHFADGDTSQAITLTLGNDHDVEPDETFTLTLSNPTNGASLGTTPAATGTIQNDDAAGSFSLDGDHSGGEADGAVTFTVTRTGGSDGAATLSYAVTGSGAHPADAADFGGSLPGGTVSFADGELSKTITITPTDDSTYESDETYTLTLSNPTAGAIGTATAIGTIVNDEPVPPSLSIGDVSVIEGDSGTKTLVFTITSSFAVPAGGLSFDIATANGTATAGSDYVANSATLNIAEGDTSATFSVTVNGDTLFERNETVLVNLSNPVNALIADGQGVGTIGNDDPVPPTASLFGTDFASFTAGGFAPGGVVGGLDSNIWRVVGLSDIANPSFGFTGPAGGDFGRGTIIGAADPVTAGVYSPSADHALVIQPTAGELDIGGFIEARIQNISGATATSFDVNFDWAYRNSGDRIDNMQLAYSTDGVNFVTVPSAAFSTPGTKDASIATSFTDAHESLSLTGTVADGGYLYLRWIHASSGGSNSRDEVGIDNVAVTAHLSSDPTASISDISVSEGNSGTSLATFTITRSNGTGTGSVDFATADLTAVHGSDYVAQSGTVTFADGELSKTVSIVINGDTAHEADESFILNLSNATGFVTPISRATATILNDDAGPIAIYDLQGLGHVSPFVGQSVTTTGIVTAIDSNGYYLQDPNGDGNANTSDAIFVFTGGAPAVAIGDSVSVAGTVAEFQADVDALSVTEINSPVTTILTHDNPLPTAVVIGVGGLAVPNMSIDDDHLTSYDPQHDAIDFYESLEGMLVTVKAPSVVSDTDSFGETYVVASNGADATGFNSRGGLTLEPGDTQPERIRISTDTGIDPAFTNPHYTQGDHLDDVTGILNYAFDTYQVIPTSVPNLNLDVTLARETTTLHGDVDHLSIGTYNLENYDPSDNKADILAHDLIFNLGGPDIIGVEEVQDDDGIGTGVTLSAQQNLTNLVNAMNAIDPTADYHFVEIDPTAEGSTGGEPGGNIRNAFLYDANRVTYVPGSVQLILDPAYNGSRNPLVAQFVFNGQTITAIDMHSYSRGGSGPDFGDTQPPVISGDDRRTAMGQAARDWIDAHAATNPHVAVMGDFNGYYYEGGLQALQNANSHGAGLTNLAVALLSPEERYSYQFDGANELFDNILVSGDLAGGASYDSVHLNAEYPGNTARPTDHDPQVALIFVNAPAVARADDVATDEATAITNGNVLANNGHGADSDAENDPLMVTAVNGVAGNVGMEITLASGALLKLNADGTFAYDPNHAFDATPASGSGASNTPAHDSFTYTLAGGGTATVTVTIDGLDSNDLLLGTVGNDALNGGLGVDQMTGGTGNDIYLVDNAGDRVVEASGEGFDQVYSSTSYALAAGVEVEVLSVDDYAATTAINLSGNEFGQQLIGNAGANVLSGGGGADALYGLGGDDVLVGGVGGDAMVGGAGNDIYLIDDAGDVIVEAAGEGFDQIYSAISYAVAAGVEVEVLSVDDYAATNAINLTGNEFGQQLFGNAGVNVMNGGGGSDVLYGLGGDDVLIGGAGSDSLLGGTGNDVYLVGDGGDVVVEASGEGFDQVYSSASYALDAGAAVEVLSVDDYAATNAINLSGNEFDQQLIGNAGANVLSGGGGNDALYGLGGDDVLVGGAGGDLMLGGAGNDIYLVDNAGDSVVEAAGEGFDQVYSSTSYALAAGVEVEVLSVDDYAAATAINLSGNEFGQQLFGNAGANVLDGGGGNDTLFGGAGADTFSFTTALGPDNIDTIVDFQSGTDKIILDDAIFDGISRGALGPGVFGVGTVATDEDQRIVYDQTTGNLYYDADGSGAGEAVLFATLQSHPVIAAGDFTVI